MLFRTLTKTAFQSLIENLLAGSEVVGPKRVGSGVAGKPLHQFLPVASFDELDLGYATTDFSAKTYFLPFKETLSTFRFADGDWEQDIRYRIQPRALVGLHACDIQALVKLDKVLARDAFPSPYYLSRRRNTFVVGIDHEPLEDCFCRSLGTDVVTHGFDLFLTDLGDRYFVAVGSDRGFNALAAVAAGPVDEADSRAYLAVRRRHAEAPQGQVPVHDLPTLLDLEFDSPVWKKWGERCLSCGSCAQVCPTCYCYGICERVSTDLSQATRTKQLHSCNLVDFATVAGGHNFRPTRESRLKYRYYHQHRGFVEAYDEPKCVGCNRCGRTCLSGINPAEVISDLHAEGSR